MENIAHKAKAFTLTPESTALVLARSAELRAKRQRRAVFSPTHTLENPHGWDAQTLAANAAAHASIYGSGPGQIERRLIAR